MNFFQLCSKGSVARSATWLLTTVSLAGCGGDEPSKTEATTPVTVGTPTTSGSQPASSAPTPTPSQTNTAAVPTPSMTSAPLPTPSMSVPSGSTAVVPTGPASTTAAGPDQTVPVPSATPSDSMSSVVVPSATVADPSTGGAGGSGNPVATGGAGGTGETVQGPIVPTKSGNTYTIAIGDASLVADGPSGRITGLSLQATELLIKKGAGDDATASNYGSSFWTSPQADWEWPPQVDAVTYTHALDAATNIVTLGSGEFDLISGATLKVAKALSGDAAKQAFLLDYTIENVGTGAVSAAPWEITRVESVGFAFYPQGAAAPQAAPNTDDPYEEIAGTEIVGDIVWYDFGGADERAKSVGDGAEGWLAYVNDDYIFVKQFEDIAAGSSAPGHFEVEVYSAPENEYIELEVQGSIASIAAGATSAPWQVHWYLRPLPTDIDTAKGSTELVDWVRALIAQ